MSYSLTPEDVASITKAEGAFGTTRLLPDWEKIPEEFKGHPGNIYAQIAEHIFMGSDMPPLEIEMKPGFDPELVNSCVRAHLTSWSPKHQHKIAGVGFMIYHTMTIHPSSKS